MVLLIENNMESKMKNLQLPNEALISYFDLDVDNCLMTRDDFCNLITKLINNPEKEIQDYYDELIIWVNDRAEKGWYVEEPITTKDELLKFWNTDFYRIKKRKGE
tara:strand:- start:216 stop:530 length:315 start_codon:yes stop_codon:yes gene_type:complete